MKKTYDEILDEVIGEITDGKYKTEHFIVIKSAQKVKDAFREAAERYRAQVELPSDDEIYMLLAQEAEKIGTITSVLLYVGQRSIGAKWMRDHIDKQLNDKK